jgi:hypothetical protein
LSFGATEESVDVSQAMQAWCVNYASLTWQTDETDLSDFAFKTVECK